MEKKNFKKEEYNEVYKKINVMFAIAILCILLGITAVLFGIEILQESQIGIGIFGILLLAAFVLLIVGGVQNQNYRKMVQQIPICCYEEKEKKAIKKKKIQSYIVGGIILGLGGILAIAMYFFEVVEELSLLPIAILFLCLSMILPQMAFWKLEEEKTNSNKYNQQEEKKEKRRAIYCGIGIFTTIFFAILGWIFFQDWDISFGIFFVGSILSILISLERNKKRE